MVKTSKFATARWLRGITTGLVLGLAASSASALTIVHNFIPAGETYNPGTGTAAGGPATFGGTGNLQNIFSAAANWWEAAILDSFTVTLSFGWSNPDAFSFSTTLADHTYVSGDGSPHREDAGRIRFNNSYDWYLGADPLDNSEYSGYTDVTMNLGGTDGEMNIGRGFSTALGDAIGRFDLFSVALHEIGHALGLSSANPAFTAAITDPGAPAPRQLALTSPLTHAGAVIPISRGSAHIQIPEALMWPFATVGVRTLISDADILANCQISQFEQCVLNPQISQIPEPGTLALVGISLVVMGWVSRRQRRQH